MKKKIVVIVLILLVGVGWYYFHENKLSQIDEKLVEDEKVNRPTKNTKDRIETDEKELIEVDTKLAEDIKDISNRYLKDLNIDYKNRDVVVKEKDGNIVVEYQVPKKFRGGAFIVVVDPETRKVENAIIER